MARVQIFAVSQKFARDSLLKKLRKVNSSMSRFRCTKNLIIFPVMIHALRFKAINNPLTWMLQNIWWKF